MDTTQTITHISLCAGYGGIDLGLRRAIPNLRTVAFSEIEGFACANLVSKMEAGLLDCAPIWTDLKTFPWRAFRDRVDILSGGYPCQPFSAAGKRLGTDDPRHLWPFIADGIRLLRPRLCFFENVEGHISLGLREVIGELESMGYKVSWGIFSAREVGAPHQRKRVFILAHRKCTGLEGWRSAMQPTADRCWSSDNARKSRDLLADTNNSRGWKNQQSTELWSSGIEQSSSDQRRIESRKIEEGSTQSREAMANTDSIGNTRSRHELGMPSETRQGGENIAPNRFVSTLWPSRPGQPQHGWEPPRVVGNAQHNGLHQCGQEARGQESCGEQGGVQESERGSASMANSSSQGCDWRPVQDRTGEWSVSKLPQPYRGKSSGIRNEFEGCGASDRGGKADRQTQSTMGGDADGTASGMDYAELSVTCDNRTDELRLLGNGVVPATATLAFQTLLAELLNE